jgi:hypothetical protein
MLSAQLQERYGHNFALRGLRRMFQSASQFTDESIVAMLSTQLSWSHIIQLLPLKSMDAKLYYASKVQQANMSVHVLRYLILRKAYDRRDIENLNLPHLSRVPFNTFKDPYLLDALDLQDNF